MPLAGRSAASPCQRTRSRTRVPSCSRPAILAACACVLALCSAPAAAQDTPAAPVVGGGLTGQPTVLRGDLVLETVGLYAVLRDYADAAAPGWQGFHDHSADGSWARVLADGDLLVGLREGSPAGLDIVDISDPQDLVTLAAVEGTSYTAGWLADSTLLVSIPTAVFAYDLSDPRSPAFASVILAGDHPGDRWFSAAGPLLYLVDRGRQVRVLDVADPLQPADLGTIDLAGDSIAALAAGDGVLHALLVSGSGAARRIDLASHAIQPDGALVQTGSRTLASGPDAVAGPLAIAGELLLAAAGAVHAFGLAEPTAPAPLWQLAGPAEHLAISTSQIFVGHGAELRIHARADGDAPPAAPVVREMLPRLQTIDGQGPVQLAQLHGDRSVLLPVDVSNPTYPRLGDAFETGVDGTFLQRGSLGVMVATEGVLQFVDLSQPAAPSLRGQIDEPGTLFLDGTLGDGLFAVETLGESVATRIYDVSDPDQPQLMTGIEDYGVLAIDGDLLVFRRLNRVAIYDIADPDRPKLASAPSVPGSVMDAEVHRGHLLVLAELGPQDTVVHTFDVGNPRQPVLVQTVSLGRFAADLDRHQDRLYATGYNWGQILAVADPAAPSLLAEFRAWGQGGRGLAFHGDVTTVSGWLLTVRDESFLPTAADEAPRAHAAVELAATPNPFNPATTVSFRLGTARDLAVTIHDLRGRRVAELAHGHFAAGRHTLTWRGRDGGGQPVASGVYVVRVHGSGLEATRLITLLK